ncbi:MAG TPA: hypothetical protein VMW63_11050 [Methanoregulaceae archaeon]|nr:hypothetical protein [Methanoregulaceae archaeon]
MPNNPYDEFLKDLAKMVEDILQNIPRQDHARFIGCTIISGNPSDNPHIFRINPGHHQDIEYEVIESDDRIFITAEIPPGISSAVYADIGPEKVAIVTGEKKTWIELRCQIDLIHSFYQVRHGVIDIVLKKKNVANPIP